MITGAQGVQTFAKAGGKADLRFANLIASFMLSNARTSTGTFIYRRGRLHVKPVPYACWSDGPMCLAFAHLATARARHSDSDTDGNNLR